MRVSTRYPIAIHTMAMIAVFQDKKKVTGDMIAASTGNNPVVVRNIMARLKEAGLIRVSAGVGGAFLAKPPEEITLWDIYTCVEPAQTEEIFKFHDCGTIDCMVAKNITGILSGHFDKAVSAMEHEFSQVTLQDIVMELSAVNQVVQ